MTIDDKIIDEKLQYHQQRSSKNIRIVSGKINKYEYLKCEEILPPPNQSRVIEIAKFTYSPLGKTFEKTNKNN